MKDKFVKIIGGRLCNFEKIGQGEITYKVTYGTDPVDYINLRKDGSGIWKVETKINTPTYIDRIALELNDAIESSDDND